MVQSKLDKRLEGIDHNLLDLLRHVVAASSLTEERLTTMGGVLDKILMRLEQGAEKATETAFFDIGRDDVDCTRAEFCLQCQAELPTMLHVAESKVDSLLSLLQDMTDKPIVALNRLATADEKKLIGSEPESPETIKVQETVLLEEEEGDIAPKSLFEAQNKEEEEEVKADDDYEFKNGINLIPKETDVPAIAHLAEPKGLSSTPPAKSLEEATTVPHTEAIIRSKDADSQVEKESRAHKACEELAESMARAICLRAQCVLNPEWEPDKMFTIEQKDSIAEYVMQHGAIAVSDGWNAMSKKEQSTTAIAICQEVAARLKVGGTKFNVFRAGDIEPLRPKEEKTARSEKGV